MFQVKQKAPPVRAGLVLLGKEFFSSLARRETRDNGPVFVVRGVDYQALRREFVGLAATAEAFAAVGVGGHGLPLLIIPCAIISNHFQPCVQ